MASLEEVTQKMQHLSESDRVPSNVSELLQEARETLENEDEDLSVRVNTASSILDRVSNDPNIKQHTRTEIWNLASKVESLED